MLYKETIIEDNRPRDDCGYGKGTVIVGFDNGKHKGNARQYVDDRETLRRHQEFIGRSLRDYLPFIHEDNLTSQEQLTLRHLLRESFAYTMHYWKPANCHQCGFEIFRLFKNNPQLVPNDTSIALVTAVTNHTWIEVGTPADNCSRGSLVIDATGLPPPGLHSDDYTPYFGSKTTAPMHLKNAYINAQGYRIETLDGSVRKTKPYHFWPWDEPGFDPSEGILRM